MKHSSADGVNFFMAYVPNKSSKTYLYDSRSTSSGEFSETEVIYEL
jgi:hypothetical protein